MRRGVAIALSALIVAAIPAILVGNALWLLLQSWFVEAQYALPGFPDGRGLSEDRRTELAITGVRAVRPFGEGVALLRGAALPDGTPAFTEREIRHMADVRAVLGGFLLAWAVATGVALVACLWLRRVGEGGSVGRALRRGALLTVAMTTVTGVVMAIDYEWFFAAFHAVFFEGRTWRFTDDFTLRRLYPDPFWGVAGATVAALILLQAAALVAAPRYRRRAVVRR